MSDARWIETFDDINAALVHMKYAIDIHGEGEINNTDFAGYKASMAFMHAMQSGHTSLESALVRILTIIGEPKPVGDSWHRDLVKRVSRDIPDRQAILDPVLAANIDITRAFRNVATRNYDNFHIDGTQSTVTAARYILEHLQPAIVKFKNTIDPPETDMSGGPR